MTEHRCSHGFLGGERCFVCALPSDAEVRREALRTVASDVVCAICGSVGHVAKYCNVTVVGRRRRNHAARETDRKAATE
jgi:hypothetical protein